MAERLSRISDPDRRRALYAGCHLLAGLAFSQLTIDTHILMSILEQSVTYQAAPAQPPPGTGRSGNGGHHRRPAAGGLEALVEALLAFNGLEDLAAWLEQQCVTSKR